MPKPLNIYRVTYETRGWWDGQTITCRTKVQAKKAIKIMDDDAWKIKVELIVPNI